MTIREMAEKNYKRGLWTIEMLAALVERGKLSESEYQEICEQEVVK